MHLFGSEFFGLAEHGGGGGVVAALDVGAVQVDEYAGASFQQVGRDGCGVDLLGAPDGFGDIAEFDGDGDPVDGDVGGPEAGPQVVAVGADAVGRPPSPAQVTPCGADIVGPRGGQGGGELQRAPYRPSFRPAAVLS